MTTDKLSDMDRGALGEHEDKVRRDLMQARFDHALGKLVNTATLKNLRKDLARVLTKQIELKKDVTK